MCVGERPADLDDGHETATGHSVEITALADGVDWGLVVLEGDFDQRHCLLLAVEDLEDFK